MTGRTALRICMFGLVLLNLVFVQITQAAGTHFLIPLYALTLFSPFTIIISTRTILAFTTFFTVRIETGTLRTFAIIITIVRRTLTIII